MGNICSSTSTFPEWTIRDQEKLDLYVEAEVLGASLLVLSMESTTKKFIELKKCDKKVCFSFQSKFIV
jgi:hypothetical protein